MKLTCNYHQDSNKLTLYFPDKFDSINISDGSITTVQLGDNAVTTLKIVDEAVEAVKLATASITSEKVATAAIGSSHLQDALITTAKIANLAVDTSRLADLTITAGKLASSCVEASKIANLAVGAAAIASLAVGTAKIADAAILEAKIDDGAITTAKIYDAAIVSAKIADLSVIEAKIGDLAVSNAKIANLDTSKITTGLLAITRTAAKCTDAEADRTFTHTANNASHYTGSAIATAYTTAKCTDANADQTSTHTAANAASYTGALILTSYTTAKCTDANADETSANGQNLGWIIGTGGELTISSGGKMKLNTADALEIMAAGNIKVLAGGDIELIGSSSNPGELYFKGTSYSIKMGLNTTGSEFNIDPITNGVTDFKLGAGFIGSNVKYFDNIYLRAKNSAYLETFYSSSQGSKISVHSTSTVTSIKLGTMDASSVKTIVFYHNGTTKYFGPESNNDIDFGRTSYQWKNVYAGTAFKGPLTNNGAYIQARSANKVSFNWTGSQLHFYVDNSNVKTFVIQHPVKSKKYLVHGTLEGPEACVFYRGTGKLEKGYAEINLPDYFEALTKKDGRTIMLTMIDGFDKMMIEKQDHEKIKSGKFCVRSENPYSAQEFDWEVKAVRKDVRPLIVEPNKADCVVKGMGPYTYI